jgi:hypothetical protein
MATWSEEKLREVVSRKGNPKATTDIVCKFFINAIEDGKYGWFWCVPAFSFCHSRRSFISTLFFTSSPLPQTSLSPTPLCFNRN